MANFNFTVRATDNTGSYADRQFNINVLNSNVERFMLVNSTTAYTSPDGLSWTTRSGQGGSSVVHNGSMWVVSGSVFTRWSVDGINFVYRSFGQADWRNITSGVLNETFAAKTTSGSWIAKLCRCNDYLVGIISFNSIRYFVRTKDGISWEYEEMTSITTKTLNPTTHMSVDGNTIFFGVMSTDVVFGYRSDDSGKTWRALVRTQTAYNVNLITRINGLYLAFPSEGATSLLYSNDGINWAPSSYTFNNSAGFSITSVLYHNGRLVATASHDTNNATNTNVARFIYSTDGISWFQNEGAFTTNSRFGRGTTVFRNGYLWCSAIGVDGTYHLPQRSVDGVTWELPSHVNNGIQFYAVDSITGFAVMA